MKDFEIRENFHKKILKRHHLCEATLVIDELGLKHGKCRADIAVINGHLSGFEIKSDKDSLVRLTGQINNYNRIFDYSTLIVGTSHIEKAFSIIPPWWGVINCTKGKRGAVSFKTIRRAKRNKQTDPKSIAQLLWRNEVEEILVQHGVSNKALRQRRTILYEQLAKYLDTNDLRVAVKSYLKKRTDWRDPEQSFLYDDSCQHSSM